MVLMHLFLHKCSCFFFSLVLFFCVVSIIMTSIAASVLGTLYITEQSTKTPSVFPPGQVPTPPWIGVRWLNSGCRRKKQSGGSKRRPAWRPDLHPAPWSRARPCPLLETPLPSWTRWTDRSREGGCSDISYKTQSIHIPSLTLRLSLFRC